MPSAGERIGPYELLRRLGGGAFGEVWLVRHLDLRVERAMKIPTDPDYVKQLRLEGQIQFDLKHPHIVETLELDSWHTPPYFVMEYVEGQDLRKVLNARGKLPVPEALGILTQILDALSAAHAMGTLHRDLKPENILLTPDGRVKVADFGLGKVQAQVAQSLILSGSMVSSEGKSVSGTFEYMSPEQRRGDPPDPRDDLYAVGIVGCELLTGSRPTGAGIPSMFRRAGMGKALCEVFERALDEREHRYGSARDWQAALSASAEAPDSRADQPRAGRPAGVDVPSAKQQGAEPRNSAEGRKAPRSERETIMLACPSCGMRLNAPEGWRGQLAKCPGCHVRIRVSEHDEGFSLVPFGAAHGDPLAAESVGRSTELEIGLGDAKKMLLVRIPAGLFLMGDENGDVNEKPMHRVSFSKAFHMAKFAVTQDQWGAVIGKNPSQFKGPSQPVDSVSWEDCQVFIRELSHRVGRTFSLPSEAEWEYACRAGTAAKFCFGMDAHELGDYAWYDANSGGATHPVGQKKPNAWGLYDMHGNVWEWCADVWHDTYAGGPVDGTPWVDGGDQSGRVLRGGSWDALTTFCRCATRGRGSPRFDWSVNGFRIVLRDF